MVNYGPYLRTNFDEIFLFTFLYDLSHLWTTDHLHFLENPQNGQLIPKRLNNVQNIKNKISSFPKG